MLTMLERMRRASFVLPQGKHLTFAYEMYCLPNIWLALMLINPRMRFEQIAFVSKRIVPLG